MRPSIGSTWNAKTSAKVKMISFWYVSKQGLLRDELFFSHRVIKWSEPTTSCFLSGLIFSKNKRTWHWLQLEKTSRIVLSNSEGSMILFSGRAEFRPGDKNVSRGCNREAIVWPSGHTGSLSIHTDKAHDRLNGCYLRNKNSFLVRCGTEVESQIITVGLWCWCRQHFISL